MGVNTNATSIIYTVYGPHRDTTLFVCVQVCSLYPTCCSWCCAASPCSSWRTHWDSTRAWEGSAPGRISAHCLEVGSAFDRMADAHTDLHMCTRLPLADSLSCKNNWCNNKTHASYSISVCVHLMSLQVLVMPAS